MASLPAPARQAARASLLTQGSLSESEALKNETTLALSALPAPA